MVDSFTDWEYIAPALKLNNVAISDIKKDNANSSKQQRLICLKTWKEKEGDKATYHAFIQALLGQKNVDAASKIIKQLKENGGIK